MLARGLVIVRHFAGVAVAAAVAWVADTFGIEVTAEAVDSATNLVTITGVTLFTAVYAAAEKLLKPLFEALGEIEAKAGKL